MKAISLHQPWAELVMSGEKKIETRSWMPPRALVGERIAIHASRTKAGMKQVEDDPTFMSYVRPGVLKYGCLIGTVLLHATHPMGVDFMDGVSPLERMFGHYSVDRYAWHLLAPQRIVPIAYRGSQGFFWVEDDLVAAARIVS